MDPVLKNLLRAIAFLVFIPTSFGQSSQQGTIRHMETIRSFSLYFPPGYSPEANMPLVLNMHGFGSNAVEQLVYSEMFQVADTAGFVLCYPNGLQTSWNVGWDFGSQADDVGFLSALIDTLVADYSLDPSRVYACGMSNGGFMSYSLACELNDKVAAIASVTGALSPAYAPTCEPGRAVPVMQIHGTADDVVGYEGTPGVNIPVEEVVQFWVANNGCDTTPVIIQVPDIDPNDGCTAQRLDYQNCTDDKSVSFYRITDGKHTWPGATLILDITNQDFEASVEIWRFFSKYQLDELTSSLEPNSPVRKLKPYPNPAGDQLYLGGAADLEGGRYELYHATGQTVMAGSVSRNNQPISLADLPPGMYVLIVQTPSGRRLSSKILHR